MSAVITDRLKKQLLVDMYKDFQDSANNYFAGIGRSENWNDSDVAPVPTNSVKERRDARLQLQSVKNITDITFAVPRENWVSGAVYSAYDDYLAGYPTNSYYAMNNNQQIYLCLQVGRQANGTVIASTVQPTGNTTGTPFRTADGYMWKFIYSIGALKASKFISSAYIPVARMQDSALDNAELDEIGVDSDSPAEDVEQQTVQNNAIGGQIVGYAVTKAGSGYPSAPSATIIGDGTEAKATVNMNGGAIVSVTVRDSDDGTIAFGSGYTFANIKLTSVGEDSAAEIRAIIAPENGLGFDARDDLKSSALMFNTKPDGAEGGDFIVGNDFRQISLLKNLTKFDSSGGLGAKFTEETGRGLKKLEIGSVNDGPFVKDVTIEGSNSLARAIIDDVNDSGDIWYHQTEATGFETFDSGDTLSIVVGGGSTTATVNKVLKGEFDPHSGELLYIDNRAAVLRSTDQTEDLKVVIQL